MTTALTLETFGGGLERHEVPRPVPAAGEVLVEVEVAASGVNPLDLKIRDGGAAHARVSVPAALGIDLAGTVVAARQLRQAGAQMRRQPAAVPVRPTVGTTRVRAPRGPITMTRTVWVFASTR